MLMWPCILRFPSRSCKAVDSTKALCASSGFNLTQFVSKDKELLKYLRSDDLASSVKSIDLTKDQLPIDKTLGVQCYKARNTFIVSSIFDPLGFISPIVLGGKRILQKLCQDNFDWDTPVP